MIASLAAPFLLWLTPALPATLAPLQGRPAANPASTPTRPPVAFETPPIQEEGEFYVLNFAEPTANEEGLMNLEEFVKVCQEATGLNFTYTKETAQTLAQFKVRMFGTKRIPKKDFYSFFQILMFINEYACVEVGPRHMSVIVIQGLNPAGRAGAVSAKPVYVDPSQLDSYLDQPAVYIRTLLHLPNTDVRQMSNALRQLLPNANWESMLNVGQENSVILTGFGSNIASLARLLQLVDDQSAGDGSIEPVLDVIPLEFAAAQDVADVIDELLEARNKTLEEQRRARPVNPEGGAGGATNTGQAKILVDERTNSLLVMALPDDLPNIKDFVARLDVDVVEPERNYHIYSLENVVAKDLQEVLDDFLQDASRLQDSGTGTGGRAPGATGGTGGSSSNDIVVVADEGTNSLLIAANKTRYAEVLELIRQLDRRQDQVLIETALIELTGTDELDLGVELGFSDVKGDGGFGVTNFGLSTFIDSDEDGIVDIKQPNVVEGITGGILSGDNFALPVLLRLFRERNDTNVLNVPSVLVNNNGSATVTTKDEQPTTTLTTTGAANGQTQETFDGYQEAGIVLKISPSISASRYLRLGIELTVSNFVGTFSGPVPPPRITRELKTVVNVPDGDTMVIGGIITDNQQSTRRSTPWLGDIPLLGALFRRDSSANTRTTLYFFVTPHILHDRDFADLAEISYKKKLSASEVMGQDRMNIVDPEFGREGRSSGLESFEIPLYQSPQRGEVSAESVGLTPMERNKLLSGDKQPKPDQPAAPVVAPPPAEQLEAGEQPVPETPAPTQDAVAPPAQDGAPR